MVLHRSSKVSVESFVDLASDVPVRHEIDQLNERITLFFGRDELVLHLGHDTLATVVDAGAQALSTLATTS